MPLNEFLIISKYFSHQDKQRSDVIRGIGDDCALLDPPSGQQLAVTTDTLVSGVHFFEHVSPELLGHKTLAVNLSDCAAMGATPAWITLSLTMPKLDEEWIEQFCKGFFQLANRYQVQLVGGDLTQGPLSMTVQVIGFVDQKQALCRHFAQENDLIFVSGTIGDAGGGLELLKDHHRVLSSAEKYLCDRLHKPEPRLELGKKLAGIASAAIDISDGCAADLSHILELSHVGAMVNVDQLPLSQELIEVFGREKAEHLALSAGDDYELCFTMSKENYQKNQKVLDDFKCTMIGRIEKEKGLRLMNQNKVCDFDSVGYQHFRERLF